MKNERKTWEKKRKGKDVKEERTKGKNPEKGENQRKEYG
jgi:hypothetical protein